MTMFAAGLRHHCRMDKRESGRVYGTGRSPQEQAPPTSGPPISGPPTSGPPVSGPPTSGPPVSGPPAPVWPAASPLPRPSSPGLYGTPVAPGAVPPADPAGSTRVIPSAGALAGRVAQRRWLMPAAVALLAAGVLAGCVMGGLALLPSGHGQKQSGLPGVIDEPSSTPVAEDPTLSPPAEESSAPTRQVPAVAVLRGAGSSGCLEAGKKQGSRAKRDNCDGSGRQRWQLKPVEGGAYQLVNEATGDCLDVDHRGKNDGAAIQSWGCNKGENQRWAVSWQGADTFTLVSVNSNKCLAGDDELEQQACRNDSSQLWSFAG